jgi:hypothetical protein
MEPAGRDPGRAFGAPAVGPVTLCSQKKSSPFRTIFSPAWGMGPWTMPEVECRPRNYLGDYPYRPSPPQQCPRNYLGSGPRGPPILIVVLQLLAAELVCLPVIKDRRSRLSFPSLELHEATRPWTLIFRHPGKPAGHTIWHLDEVYLKIAGRMAYLWRLESVHYCMCWPPLIAILAPVTNAASSEHR